MNATGTAERQVATDAGPFPSGLVRDALGVPVGTWRSWQFRHKIFDHFPGTEVTIQRDPKTGRVRGRTRYLTLHDVAGLAIMQVLINRFRVSPDKAAGFAHILMRQLDHYPERRWGHIGLEAIARGHHEVLTTVEPAHPDPPATGLITVNIGGAVQDAFDALKRELKKRRR
jgi:hypothetical protein